jgi:Tol biopolymer transport system component
VQTVSGPAFSPDDKHLAFNARPAPGQESIWVIPVTGGAAVQVVPPARGALYPSWSPDGQWLCYRANYNGNSFLEKVRLGDLGHPVTLSETTQGVRPVWSPSGRWIALATPQGVSVISPDGRVKKHVHSHVTSWMGTGWSRDGKTLYLAVTDGYQEPPPSTLWAINPETGRERVLARYSGVWISGAPWMGLSASADGKSLAASLSKSNQSIWMIEGLTTPQTLWHRLFHAF